MALGAEYEKIQFLNDGQIQLGEEEKPQIQKANPLLLMWEKG